jgi:hypothetical protein
MSHSHPHFYELIRQRPVVARVEREQSGTPEHTDAPLLVETAIATCGQWTISWRWATWQEAVSQHAHLLLVCSEAHEAAARS